MAVKGFYWKPAPDEYREQIKALTQTNANAVVVPHESLTPELMSRIREHGLTFFVDVALFTGAQLRSEFPDSAPIDEFGAVLPDDDWYVPVCPNNLHVRNRNLERLAALLDRHGSEIDGVWLDFIRYPVRWEVKAPALRQVCFCDHCLSLYFQQRLTRYTDAARARLTHTLLKYQIEAWSQWKCGRITEFVETLRGMVHTANPSATLGLFCLPWRSTDHNDAIRTIAGQDIEQLAAHSDFLSPMVYHSLCYQDPHWIRDVIQDVKSRSAKPVLPVVQSLDSPNQLSASELGLAIDFAAQASGCGILIFDFESVRRSADKLAIVQEMFG